MNNQKKRLLKRILRWLEIAFLLTGLICGLLLIYQWWSREQKLARLKSQLAQKQQQIQQQYNLQDLNLISTADLANSPAIHSFFTNLLTTYAEKFARSKGLNTSQLPLKFAGFYYEPEADRKLGTGQGLGIMGRCFPNRVITPYQKISISLNRLYLLNKLGHDKYFTSKPTYGEYYFIDISFKKMIETCSHEIAHYIQLVKHNKSSCESDLVINKENYDGELAREHEEWTGEICQLIKNSPGYGEWERRWKVIEGKN